jgi:hypothetical protein
VPRGTLYITSAPPEVRGDLPQQREAASPPRVCPRGALRLLEGDGRRTAEMAARACLAVVRLLASRALVAAEMEAPLENPRLGLAIALVVVAVHAVPPYADGRVQGTCPLPTKEVIGVTGPRLDHLKTPRGSEPRHDYCRCHAGRLGGCRQREAIF